MMSDREFIDELIQQRNDWKKACEDLQDVLRDVRKQLWKSQHNLEFVKGVCKAIERNAEDYVDQRGAHAAWDVCRRIGVAIDVCSSKPPTQQLEGESGDPHHTEQIDPENFM